MTVTINLLEQSFYTNNSSDLIKISKSKRVIKHPDCPNKIPWKVSNLSGQTSQLLEQLKRLAKKKLKLKVGAFLKFFWLKISRYLVYYLVSSFFIKSWKQSLLQAS